MDSAARNTKRSGQILDGDGYKFGGDTGEILNSQGKGSSLTSTQPIIGKGTRTLSVKAKRRLEALSEISTQGKVVKDLFRLMGDPSLWMLAYSNIYPNKGAMTPGVDNSTMDGFSEDRALNLIETLKEGLYNHKPVRRTYIPKSNGKVRPLGIPTGDDKLVQEVTRIILERIYEPIFSDWSHGFRPGRSCHTALSSIQKGWHGVKWIINVDIKGYFDNIDHEILISLLEKRIDDKRFINLIKLMLKAGCIEDWNYHGTYTGTPQGGIISPLLSNIYLHEMDIFAEKLKCEFDAGKGRRRNAVYRQYESIIHKGWKRIGRVQDAGGDEIEVARIRQQISDAQSRQRQVHYGDPFDPTYRRLHYCRYADDFTIGIIGNKAEAAGIFNKVKEFINGSLNLEISEEKSGISHFEKGFEYLGYVVASNVANKLMKVRNLGGVALKRTIRGAVTLQVPTRVGLSFAKNHGYIRAKDHRATHINTLLRRSDEEIILTYNAEFRGLALYYALAKDVKRKLGWLEYVKTGSMLATLAAKHKSSMNKMHKMLSDNGELVYKTQVKGKTKRLVVYKLKHLKVPGKSARVDVEPNVSMFKHSRTEIIDRLNAGKCEYCRKTKGYFEVHHKNKLKDTAPGIERALASMRRKTIVLCVECHHKLHAAAL